MSGLHLDRHTVQFDFPILPLLRGAIKDGLHLPGERPIPLACRFITGSSPDANTLHRALSPLRVLSIFREKTPMRKKALGVCQIDSPGTSTRQGSNPHPWKEGPRWILQS